MIHDSERDAILAAARVRFAAMLEEHRSTDRASLSADEQAEHDSITRKLEQLLRVTEPEVVAMIEKAVEHAGRELTAPEVMALIGDKQ